MTQELKAQNQTLRHIIQEIWWMARRYADGRSSYATSMFNDAIRQARKLGCELRLDYAKTIFARDGMGPGYGGLSVEEYAMGEPVENWTLQVVPEETRVLREQSTQLQSQLKDTHDRIRYILEYAEQGILPSDAVNMLREIVYSPEGKEN